MKSPFPGMDPYLEARWSDVHTALAQLIKESLQPQLPAGLRARSEERVLLEEESEPPQRYQADVAVIETGGRRTEAAPVAAATATVEPIRVRFHDAPVIDRFVQIIDTTTGNRIITAIEILSPWNKAPGRLNRAYLHKLDDYARSAVNVVEIDLLRYPSRGRLKVSEADIPPQRRAPYAICVRDGRYPDTWDVYPVSLRQPVTPVPVPLRPGDRPVALSLQPLIDRAYATGGHDDIDYTKPCDPPLAEPDAAWADQLLQTAGKR